MVTLSLRAKVLLLFAILSSALLFNLFIVANMSSTFATSLSQITREGLGKQLITIKLELHLRALETSLHRFMRSGSPSDREQFRYHVALFRSYVRQYEAIADSEAERTRSERLYEHVENIERLVDRVDLYRRRQRELEQALQETFEALSDVLDEWPRERVRGKAVSAEAIFGVDRAAHDLMLAVVAYAEYPTPERRAAVAEADDLLVSHLATLRQVALNGDMRAQVESVAQRVDTLRRLSQEMVNHTNAREAAFDELEETTVYVERIIQEARGDAVQDTAETRRAFERSLARTWRVGLIVSLGAVVIGLLGSSLLLWRLHTTVGHVVETLEHIEAGDFSRRIALKSDDELGRIARAFNQVMDEVTRQRVELEKWGTLLETRIAERTERLQRALEEINALYTLTQKLSSVLELDQVLHVVYQEVKSLVNFDVFYIALYDQAADEVRAALYVEHDRVLSPFAFKRDEAGLAGWIIRTGQHLFVPNMEAEHHRLPVPPRLVGRPFGASCYFGVPLQVHGRTIGVLSVQRELRHGGPFDEDERRFVMALAGHVAVAIENARLYQALLEAAQTEPLTGLYNRRHFEKQLKVEIERARRHQWPLSLVMMDLDGLKQVNDTFGHACGDRLLVATADLLRRVARQTDMLARLGGRRVRGAPARCRRAGGQALRTAPPPGSPRACHSVWRRDDPHRLQRRCGHFDHLRPDRRRTAPRGRRSYVPGQTAPKGQPRGQLSWQRATSRGSQEEAAAGLGISGVCGYTSHKRSAPRTGCCLLHHMSPVAERETHAGHQAGRRAWQPPSRG
ncbi:MAG: diguanylate cyclase [Ardenticatenia bacterium]|nr:diguanylate cyclase [Ardenticatenia bacterium]